MEQTVLLVGILIAFAVALAVTALMHPRVAKFAQKRNVVDNPNARKLQRNPVPVMGGVAVFFGLVSGLCVSGIFVNVNELLPVVVAMSVMLCVGVIDDVSELSPWLRFVIEIAVVLMLIFTTHISLDSLQGLWGFYDLPLWLSAPLTVFAVVGMINAINLIDGVDGLSSGFCMMASIAFGALFIMTGNYDMAVLTAITMGSLMPFFFHNVFGDRSKMFIGDGGSLMMGVAMSTYVVAVISVRDEAFDAMPDGMGLVAFTMAVMAVPVFDTLRVMTMRILRRTSPFRPDKTHLHHLFIDLGFSHIATTLSVLSLNLLVVLAWLISYLAGASVDVQFYVVIVSSVLVTAIFYKVMRMQMACNGILARAMRKIAARSHCQERTSWKRLQRIMDKRS
ncbi:MAG: undecaprenyl/decaprenyl-phosphate alpha-N-acetylglucosaminyl 1-phosphate transferase [Rikenellaceae bacterium]|nr:undecaprenyl/decaprenyl-phosphate alpha-N-acetylglucosaminyl 1-phosphate transferase [Rikenellaceae bacterium]